MALSYATDDTSNSSMSKTAASGISEFPCDLPSHEQLRDWMPDLLAKISAMGLSAYMRGAEPPYVIQYTPRDLSLTPELEAAAGEGPKETRIALRATYEHDNMIKMQMKTEWTRDQQHKVATLVLDSMRSKAVSRFETMKSTYQQVDASTGAIITGAYNGIAMAIALVAELEAGAVDEEDAEEHQEKVNAMIAARLAEGCSLKEYSDKVTLVRVKHNPYLERPYANAQLSRLYQQFLPDNLSIDARNIRRGLEDAGTWTDSDVALQAFMKLVKQVHKSDVHAAAVALAAATSAIAAAAALASTTNNNAGGGRPGG